MVPQRIEREILIDAPIDVVWSVVTEPQHIGGWFSDSVELDLRPGGKAVFHWDKHRTAHGRVERVEPPRAYRVSHLPAQPPALDESDAIQDREVLRHRLPGHRQLAGHRRGCRLPPVEEDVDHATACRIGNRRPELVDLGGDGAHPSASECMPRWAYSFSSPSSIRQPRV